MAASRFLWNQDRFQALPDAERAAPSERGPAILAPAPSVTLDRDARGSTPPARPRCGPLDATPPALVVDLGFEPLSRFLGVPGEGQSGQVIAFREDILGLPKEDADLGRAEVVGLRVLQDGLARVDDRLGLLHLRLTELHRPLDLSLLTFHREPLRTLEEIARVAVLAGGDGRLRRLMELLRLPHVGSDVPCEADVVGDDPDRLLDVANPADPRVLHALRGLDEALARRGEPIPVEEVAPSLPRVFGQGDRGTEVRGLALAFLESLAGLLEQILDPFIVDIRIASQHNSRIPLRGVLGFEFHQDFGGDGGRGDGGDQVRFPFQAQEAYPMSLPEFAELAGSKPFEAGFHSTAVRLRPEDLGLPARSERLDQPIAVRGPRRSAAMG